MNETRQRDLAKLLAALRGEGRQQSGLAPELVPPDRAAALRVARMVEEELGRAVAGWKVAALDAEMQKQLRTDAPIYGRMFAGDVRPAPQTLEYAKLCSPIPEVEYQAVLGADLPPRAAPYSRDEVAASIASIHIGIELPECRFIHDAHFPPLPAILADGAGASITSVGSAIDDWQNRDIRGQEIILYRNGVECRRGNAADAIGHPIDTVHWLANELSREHIGLKAGQTISTGTLTGMLRPKAGETFLADFGSFGTVSATYA